MMIEDSSRKSYHQDGSAQQAEEQTEGRAMQETENVFLIFRGGDPKTDAPTASPTPRPLTRDFNYRACGGDEQEFDDKAFPAGVANVHFVYDVELTDKLSRDEERTMLNALETAMIDSIFDSTCRQRRLGASRRRLEIHSISSGNRDKLQAGCTVTSSDATVCNRYDGSVKVGYTATGDNDSELEAGNTALQVVSKNMIEQDTYLDAMNLALESLDSNSSGTFDTNSTMATRISYVGTSFYDARNEQVFSGLQSENWAVQDGSMTTLGKAFVPIMVLLFVGVLLSYQKYRRLRQVGELAVYRAKQDNEYLKRKDGGDLDQFERDVRDLAMRSNTQDVHRCNKTDCAACTHQLPRPIQEALVPRKGEGYAHQDNVEVVDPDAQSLVSGLTGILGEWSWFGRSRKPEILVQENIRDSRSMESLFEDEPRSVTFVRVDEGLYSGSGAGQLGVKRKIIDHTGNVRSELEL